MYPLLVNVNGKPEFGDQARLAAVSIPLPVMSVPGGPEASAEGGAARASRSCGRCWTSSRAGCRPPTAGTLLADDELADSLAVGGRLFNLVNAVRTATAADTELLRSMCFAVDPDLLETVSKMTEGYQVRTAERPDRRRQGRGGRRRLARPRSGT